MYRIRHLLGTLVVFLVIELLPVAAIADVIVVDRSPGTFADAVLRPSEDGNWANRRDGQHFADSFMLTADAQISAMDWYSGVFWGAVGDSVSIQVWSDNGGAPDALLYELIETITGIDTDGARGNTNRKFVEFSSLISLNADTTYWIGMSGVGIELAALGLGDPGAPEDGSSAQFAGDSYSFQSTGLGDMAFRLYAVPEPGTLALFGIGLLGIGLARRRRTQ